jgi:hypothetical protein
MEMLAVLRAMSLFNNSTRERFTGQACNFNSEGPQ